MATVGPRLASAPFSASHHTPLHPMASYLTRRGRYHRDCGTGRCGLRGSGAEESE
ncbi:hypothetical protein BD779DRAFT_1556618 [Infundibulicybe gibba]|nr:hypothetical protein BD779DRAFT_1556618 [Infundibulicybe gibba]